MKLNSRVTLAFDASGSSSVQPRAAAPLRPREGDVSLRHDRRQLALPEARGLDAVSRYEISCITAQSDASHVTDIWRCLLAASHSPEKLYQTPEFFRFLDDTRSSGSDQFELIAIRDRCEDRIVGVVPVRLSSVALGARLGRVSLFSLERRVVRILGSVPLMPDDPALLQHLFAHLLAAFPDCAAVSMQAYPLERSTLLDDERHRALIVHGWRACHTIPFPATLPCYLAKLSGKKRYNLARQQRLLEQAVGPLQLKRIDSADDVGQLVASLAVLAAEHSMAGHNSARDLRVLAAHRLLLSYVLKSGEDVIAVVSGSRDGDTWHVHQICYAKKYRHLSPGAVAMHSALQNVITDFALTGADFGFGEPRHSFASTHVLKQRAHVLIVRKASAARVLLGALVRYDDWHATCVRLLRPLGRRLLRK